MPRNKSRNIKQKVRLHQYISRGVAYSSIGLFGLVLLDCLFPVAPSSSLALDNTSTSAMSHLSVKAVETVSVRLASELGIDIQPQSSGSFGIAQSELGVTTNDPEGFEVFLSTVDAEAALRGSAAQIDTISTNTVGSNFTGNTWGYSIGKDAPSETSTYSPMSSTNTSILKTDTATVDQEDVYHLGFGVHITPNLPAGEYSTSVVLSVVANPATIHDLSDLVYMQDMTVDICANTPSAYKNGTVDRNSSYYLAPITKQLYDLRDGKKYWVAKLADGNCWMTQNLALDLSTKKTLTPLNTDIAADWTPTRDTETVVPAVESIPNDFTAERSWNLGDYVYTTPTNGTTCTEADEQSDWKPTDSDDNLSPGETWADIADDCKSRYKIYAEGDDAHYKVGNYYTYSAVTAQTGNNVEGNIDGSSVASGSICPAGWTLPKSGLNTESQPFSTDNEFYKLLSAYGYPTNTDTGWTWHNGNPYTAISSSNPSIVEGPVYFTRTGTINIGNGSLRAAGRHGKMWSSSAYDATSRTFDFGFDGTNIFPAYHDSRAYGFSARCLAR